MTMEGGPKATQRGWIAWWHRTPLYLRILGALILGVIVGLLLGERADALKQISDLILRLLRTFATPLILVAVIHALLNAQISGRTGGRLIYLLATNTAMAILIGILVANVMMPGKIADLPAPTTAVEAKPFDPWQELTDKIPKSVGGPFVDNNIISVIFLAIVFGLALRVVRQQQIQSGKTAYRIVEDLFETAFSCLIVALYWIIDLIPFAVFGVVAKIVGTQGFEPFVALGAFVIAVLVALLLQVVFYQIRIWRGSWVRPGLFFRGGSAALLTAFCTASSTATMPVTYTCLKDKVGLREESASMGALVGGNFNNDGTALYEAMAALFIAQALGIEMGLGQQVVIAFMAVIASVGAPGIPEAGLVTMLLVFSAVHLPVEYVPLLLTVDWFLDRCRTSVNVMGDMTVSSLLDGKRPQEIEAVESKVISAQ